MKNLLTGAAQSVTDTNERARKLFENRPMEAPTLHERQNRPRKSFAKAPAEEDEAGSTPLNGDKLVPAEDGSEE